jgi:DNA-binding response OmpR family regulator
MSYSVLIVDDDAIERDCLAEYLGLAGFDVATADDGVQALARVDAALPDLVLLDVQMPEMDGFEVLQRLRADPRTRDLPVLLLSSVERNHIKVRGLELGADDYIVKPCPQPELLARVRAGLRRAARYHKLEHAMEGSLDEVGLDTLLLTLQIAGRTARVRFADIGAELRVGHGCVSSCHFLRFTGDAALQRILLVGRGRFTVSFEPRSSEDGERPGADATRALMDALVAVDEARRLLTPGPIATAPLELARAEAGVLESVRSSLPMSTIDLVVALDGDIRAGAQVVAAALADGTLRVVT